MAETKSMRTGDMVVSNEPGKPTALYRVNRDGIVKREIRRVPLSLASGHFYPQKLYNPATQQKDKVERIITAMGFQYLNRFSGMSFLSPGTLINDEGLEVGNPCIRRQGGLLSSVRVRRMGIGRGQNGTLRCIDMTVTYDSDEYFYMDLYEALTNKYAKAHEKNFGEVMNIEAAKQQVLHDPKKQFSPIGPGIVLLYDVTHDTVIKKCREHRQRCQYSDRLATTVCERNILKKYFGFSMVAEDLKATVVCWPQVDLDWSVIQSRIMARGGKIQIDDEEVELEVDRAIVGTEDFYTADMDDEGESSAGRLAEDSEPSGRPTPKTEKPSEPELPERHDQPDPDKIKANLRLIMRAYNKTPQSKEKPVDALLLDTLTANGMKSLKELATCDNAKVLSQMLNIVTDAIPRTTATTTSPKDKKK